MQVQFVRLTQARLVTTKPASLSLIFKHISDLFLDDVSADSSAEFPDRASMMEVRLQAQEDEITLLKSSLADALRRIRLHDQLLPLLKQQLIAGR